MEVAIVSPAEMHARAKEVKVVEQPIESLQLFDTVSGFISQSIGRRPTKCLLCGKYTDEYIIVPIPAELVDNDARQVKTYLIQQGYFVTIRADALARFNQEALMVICWDPEIIKVSKDYPDEGGIFDSGEIYCVLPGRENQPCNHCFRCHTDRAFFVPPTKFVERELLRKEEDS